MYIQLGIPLLSSPVFFSHSLSTLSFTQSVPFCSLPILFPKGETYEEKWGNIKFAACMCVCFGRISCETVE